MESGSRRAVAILAVLAVWSTSAAAQPLRLTMEDALARATTSNAALLASGKDVEVARANLERSSFWLPENPYVTGGLLQQPETGLGPNYGISLSQEFEIAGQRGKRIAVAQAALQTAEWQQRGSELALRANVKGTFVRALLAAELLALAQRGDDAMGDLVQHEHGARGDAATIAHNQLLMQKARAQREVNSARLELADSYDLLRYQIGLPPGEEIELVGAVERSPRSLPDQPELVDLALRQRADLVALQHEAERADGAVPLTKRQGIPNVTLSGAVSRFEGDTFAGGDIGFYIPVVRDSDPDVLEAVAEQQRAKLQLDDLERSIENEVRDAYRTCVAAADDLLLVKDEIAPRSRENTELQRSRFERGEVDGAEMLGLLVDSQYTQRELIEAIQVYNLALIELERSVGGSL